MNDTINKSDLRIKYGGSWGSGLNGGTILVYQNNQGDWYIKFGLNIRGIKFDVSGNYTGFTKEFKLEDSELFGQLGFGLTASSGSASSSVFVGFKFDENGISVGGDYSISYGPSGFGLTYADNTFRKIADWSDVLPNEWLNSSSDSLFENGFTNYYDPNFPQPIFVVPNLDNTNWSAFKTTDDGDLLVVDYKSREDLKNGLLGSNWYEIDLNGDYPAQTYYDISGRPIYSAYTNPFHNFSATWQLENGGKLEIDWNNLDYADENGLAVKISEKNADGETESEYSGTYDSATGVLSVNGGPTDANGNPMGPWETTIVGTAPEFGAIARKTAPTKPNGEVIGPWKTSIEFTEEYAQSIINEALRNTEGAIIGNQIGEIFGSSLGQAIAGDNIFAQIGLQTALSTVLGNVGQSLGAFLENGFDLLQGVESAFDDFSKDLFKNLQSNSISAVSSFLTAELSDVLDIPGDFGGQLLDNYIGTEVSNIANAVIGLDLSPWNPGAFLGSYLAKLVVSPETTAGAIGGSIGGAIGASIGTTILSSTSPLLGIPLVAAFVFVTTVIATILGDKIYDGLEGWFDDHGYGNAYASITSGTSTFVKGPVTGKDGDFIGSARDVRDATLETLNAILVAMGSENASDETIQFNVHHQKQADGFLNSNTKHKYWYKIYSEDAAGNKTELYGQNSLHKWNGQQWVDALTINTLKNMTLSGGNIYMQRALQNSQAKTIKDLFGDLQIASDYSQYLQNKEIVDLLIAIEPNSAFAAGWVITLVRAEELGLTEWSASDFAGGLASFFDSIGLDDIGITPDDVAISIDGTTLKLEIIVDGQVDQTIEIEDFANKIGYQQLTASTDGSVVTGTTGNDIWIAENVSSTFIDVTTATKNPSHDILIGSNFADTIDGGKGRDFIRGNGGNDFLIGGSNKDLIDGGDGHDTIYGDENSGFAAIPTGLELSDSALPNAAIAFAGSRRTWFGGTEAPEITLSHNYTPPKPDFNKDEIYGGAGNDQIAGGTGEDRLYGGVGTDTLYGDEGDDYLVGSADADIIYGGVGFDVISYEDVTQGVTVDLVNGTASDGDRLYSIEDLIGSPFNDILKGDAYSNLLDGGMGNDTIDGRDGRDAASFFSSNHAVKIDLGTGKAVTKTGEKTTQTDTLINIEDVIASTHNDTLIGSTLGGGLNGSFGNDTIIIPNDDVDVAGGAGAYDIRGGEGVDALSFANWNKSRGVKIELSR